MKFLKLSRSWSAHIFPKNSLHYRLAAAPIAAATGISAEALLLISAVGVTFIITLIQGYDNWEYDFKRQKLKLSKSRR